MAQLLATKSHGAQLEDIIHKTEEILPSDERINIYPIPTKDELTLQLLDNKLHISHYSFYNQFGQMLREEAVHLDGQKK